MRRLLCTLLLPLVLGLALVMPAAAAVEPSADTVQLAVESGEEVGGLEPRGPDDPDNANAPEDYQPNFLWGAAVGLAVLTVGGLGVLGLLYWLMVGRDEPSAS